MLWSETLISFLADPLTLFALTAGPFAFWVVMEALK